MDTAPRLRAGVLVRDAHAAPVEGNAMTELDLMDAEYRCLFEHWLDRAKMASGRVINGPDEGLMECVERLREIADEWGKEHNSADNPSLRSMQYLATGRIP
jgi:hypothetical protein